MLGALVNASLIWDMADVAMGFMALLNLVAILLCERAFAVIANYDGQEGSPPSRGTACPRSAPASSPTCGRMRVR